MPPPNVAMYYEHILAGVNLANLKEASVTI